MSQPDTGGYLGHRIPTTVRLSADNKNVAGGWVAEFRDTYAIDVDIYHIAMRGPSGSFDVYIDDAFYSTDTRSDRNEYDPKQPMHVRKGQVVSFHFSATATPAPQVWIYARQPTGVF